MAKRKQHDEAEGASRGSQDGIISEDSSGDEDTDMVDVEFEWFDPQPEHDFHGLKTLLKQLLGNDALQFNLSALADLILSQPLLGSTVKVDGNETDPYAFLTVLNLHEHRETPAIKDLAQYLTRKALSNTDLSQLTLLLQPSSSAQIGLILTERLINIPPQVVPPMYNMLLEEISWALEEKEPYQFSHYLVISKAYTEMESDLPGNDRPQKKSKKSKGSAGKEVFLFHAEDEILQRHALAHGSYEYSTQEGEGASDSKRAFQDLGIRPQGSLILIEAGKLGATVKALTDFVSPA